MLSADEWSILWLSVQVAGTSLLLLVIPGVALGWVLSRCSFAGKTLLDVLVHLPLVLPPVVTGYLLLLVFGVCVAASAAFAPASPGHDGSPDVTTSAGASADKRSRSRRRARNNRDSTVPRLKPRTSAIS